MKILVIGSGFGGLAAALRLRAKGHDVTILEKLDSAGGRACVFRQDGFTFDAGPTIITAPWLIDELFALYGKKTSDYATLVKLDPFYNVRFQDGSVFRYNGNKAQIFEQITAFSPADVAGYKKFIQKAEAIFKVGFELIDKPFDTIWSMIKVLPSLIRLRANRSVAQLVNRYIKDPRLRQVFSFHPLLVGGNPFQTTSIYALIHKLEQEWGVWFAMGGTGAIVDSLVRLFGESGGAIRFKSEVTKIVIDASSRRAVAVRLIGGEEIACDAVVCNSDLAETYRSLIAPEYRRKNTDKKIKSLRYSMSLFVMYFGTDMKYNNLSHHEIMMGSRYRELIDGIFTKKILADDFSLYLHRPTFTDPSLAPSGCDSWYVLSPVPHLGGNVQWEVESKNYRDKIVAELENRYMPELSKHIVTEKIIDPRYFETTLNSYLGSAFSIEPILTQSAWWRPHNRSEDVPNLYFVGAGTHPGAGLPGVISSAKIIEKYFDT